MEEKNTNSLQSTGEVIDASGVFLLTQGVIRSDLNRTGHHFSERFLVVQIGTRKGVRLEGLI